MHEITYVSYKIRSVCTRDEPWVAVCWLWEVVYDYQLGHPERFMQVHTGTRVPRREWPEVRTILLFAELRRTRNASPCPRLQ